MSSIAEIKQQAREALAGHWPRSIAVSAVALLLGGVSTFAFLFAQFNSLWATSAIRLSSGEQTIVFLKLFVVASSVYSIVGLVLGSFVELGHNRYYLKLLSGEELSVAEAFSCRGLLLKALFLRAFTCIRILLWSVLLVIPGFIAMVRYALAPFVLAQNPSLEIADAVHVSKAFMIGFKKHYFLLSLSFAGYIALSLLTFGAGFLFTMPYMKAAKAQFYRERVAIHDREVAGKQKTPHENVQITASPFDEPEGYYE